MKSRIFLLSVLILSILGLLSGSIQQSAEQLYQSGIYKEEVEGELEKAIAIYEQILADFPENKVVAAKALYHMGLCYEKLGNQNARKAYQRLIQEYPGQIKEVTLAKKRLARILKVKSDRKELRIRKVCDLPESGSGFYGSVSSDGQYYSYPDREKGGNLAIRNLLTGKSRLITQDKGGSAFDAKWSPDNQKLAYAWTDWSDMNTTELRMTELDGSGSRILFKKKGSHVQPFDWSSDGLNILAFHSKSPQFSESESKKLILVSVKDGSTQILKSFKQPSAFLLNQGYFSSNGKFIAYTKEVRSGQSMHHDIFLFSVDKQKEIPLINHPAEDYILGWSPDAKKLIFASNRTGSLGVWAVMMSDRGISEDLVLIKDNVGPLIPLGITDNGALYYGLRNNLSFIYQAGLEAGSGKVIDDPKKISLPYEGYNTSPCFSPEGDLLAYVSNRGVFRKFFDPVLCIYNLKNGENTEFSTNLIVLRQPRWAPDSSSIHVMGASKALEWAVYSIDPQTKTIEPVIPPEKDSDVFAHCWSEKRNSIYYLRVKPISEESAIGECRIIHHHLETGQEKELGTFRSVNSSFELFCISPDGKKLAYVQRDSAQHKDIINVLPVTGGNPEQIGILDFNKQMIMDLIWSQDSRFILYSTWNRSENHSELMRISAEGGRPEKLWISMNGISYLSLHPNGQQIAFSSGGPTQRLPEIWVMENFLPLVKSEK